MVALGALVDAFTDKTLDNLINYFICEATGYVPGKCSREEIEDPLISVMYIAIPATVLVNVINWTKAKGYIMKHTKQVGAQYTL